MCFSVNYVPACLHVHVQTYLCVCSKCESVGLPVFVNACLRVSLETAFVSGGERRSVEDGNKIKLFL